MMTLRHTILLLAALGLAASCAEGPGVEAQPEGQGALIAPLPFEARAVMVEPADADPDVFPGVYMADAGAVARFFEAGGRIVEQARPFQQINWLYDATSDEAPRYRVRWASGGWSGWRQAQVTWAEGAMHNARALLEAPAVEVEVAPVEGMTLANIELPARHLVERDAPLTRELPRVRDALPLLREAEGLRTVAQGVAPASLVTPRAGWGARDPNKICGDVVAPYRVTIHHTASPDSDGSDPAARMRQMQAYHIDNNGWCDIGYHFVVSQSGTIYQGRSDERRPGAHTGNQNAGNIGVSMIGNYEANPLIQTQIDATIKILAWIKQTYPAIGWSRANVKGHKEWPGQSTACPGKNFMARFDQVLDAAASGGTAQPGTYDVSVAVRYLGGVARDFHEQGESAGVPDVLPGDKLQAEIVVTNSSSQPLRGVKLDYMIEQPFVRATGYTIQTDHPAKDGSSWMLNDADSAPENPAKDALGEGGTLVLYAFGAGESKRVLIELEAAEYSVGRIDHPDVRGWVRQIDGVYGEQTAWDQAPELNQIKDSPTLQAFAQLDVLAPDYWSFDGGAAHDVEGWMSCMPGHSAALVNNVEAGGALSQRITGQDACVASPAWTAIDADRWEQLVMRVRSSDGAHKKAIYWARDGEPFSAERSVRFEAPGSAELESLVVPLGDHPLWTGQVVNLRIDLLDGAAPGAADSGVYEIDELFFQSATSGQTSAPGVALEQREPVRLLTGADDPDDPVDPNDPDDPSDPDDPYPGEPGEGEGAPGVSTKDGCAAAGVASAPAAPLWALSLMAVAARRRRRRP